MGCSALISNALVLISIALVETSLAKDLASNSERNQRATLAVEQLLSEASIAQANEDWPAQESQLLEAQSLLHREFGVVTPRQITIVDRLAANQVARENYSKANQLAEFNHFIRSRNQDSGGSTEADALLADWYLRSGQWRAGRGLIKTVNAAQPNDQAFDVSWALLELQMSLYSPICCNSNEALEVLRQAQLTTATVDQMAELSQTVAAILILERQLDDALPAIQTIHPSQTAQAQLLPGLHAFKSSDRDRMERTKLESDLRLRRYGSGFALDNEIPDNELIEFSVALNDRFLPIQGPNGAEFHQRTQPFERIIGSPFRYNLERLKLVLPAKYSRLDRLETLKIDMSFDVSEEGRARNIRFLNDQPRQIRKLMRDTLLAARFIPAMEDGTFVTQSDFLLTQTFNNELLLNADDATHQQASDRAVDEEPRLL